MQLAGVGMKLLKMHLIENLSGIQKSQNTPKALHTRQ
jgi:hypothetical protein